MNGFGTLGDSLEMGSCDAPVAAFADGEGTAEESDRHMPRPITPYHGVINESRWGEVRSFSPPTRCLQAFSDLFDTLFAQKSILK